MKRFAALGLLGIGSFFALILFGSAARGDDAEQIAESLSDLIVFPKISDGELTDVTEFRSLVTEKTLEDGSIVQIWSGAIEAALQKSGKVKIPASDKIYYLDRTIPLESGSILAADPEARIFALPESGFSLVANRHPINGRRLPNDSFDAPDERIVVTGGIWSHESKKRGGNGNPTFQPNAGGNGVFYFSNVHGLTLTNIRLRNAGPYSFHLSNVQDVFLSDLDIRGFSDGVHLNGPAQRVVVQNIRSQTGDDVVALNAWDWESLTPTFGPIENILIQDIEPLGGYNYFRLLPGVRIYQDGSKRACSVRNVVIRRIKKVRNFKMYAQMPVPDSGKAVLGDLDQIYFRDIELSGCTTRTNWNDHYYGNDEAPFEILANAAFVSLRGVSLIEYSEKNAPVLVAVGPRSATWTRRDESGTPVERQEVFEPNLSCVAEKIEIGEIRVNGQLLEHPEECVKAIQLSRNPDYPNSYPAGGDGRGEIKEIVVSR